MAKRNKPTPKPSFRQAAAADNSSGLSLLIRHPAFHVVILLVAPFFVYSNSFTVPFVLDDLTSIVANPLVKDFRFVFKSRIVGDASFAFNYALHGLDLEGYHLFNLFVHCSNVLLVYLLLLLTGRTPLFSGVGQGDAVVPMRQFAFCVALLFAVHPIQTQAVTYLAQRVTSLAALFYLSALALYLAGRLSTSSGRRFACWTGAVIVALLAMLTKEIAFTLPVAIALYEASFFPGTGRRRFVAVGLFSLAALTVPLALAAGRVPLGDMLGEISRLTTETDTISRSQYLFTQFRVIVTYLRLLLLPVNQNLDYDYPLAGSFFSPPTLLSSAVILVMISAPLYGMFRSRQGNGNPLVVLASFGMLWFFVTLSVESSIIPIRDVIFEHRLYLPSIGCIVAVVAVISLVAQSQALRGRSPAKLVVPALLSAALLLGGATWKRNQVWQDEMTLWEDVVLKSPGKARAHGSLARLYRDRGRMDEAVREYRAAIALDPKDGAARNNLGTIYFSRREFAAALEEYRAAAAVMPNNPKIHYNMGDVFMAQGQLAEAEQAYARSLQLAPDYAEALNNLGIVLFRQGRYRQAVDRFREAVRLNPGNQEALENLLKAEPFAQRK